MTLELRYIGCNVYKDWYFRQMIKYLALLLFITSAWSQNEDWDVDTVETSLLSYKVELFSSGYVIPWGMCFLPDGDLIVSDIVGRLYRVDKKSKERMLISGVPKVFSKGQGGMLDVEIHPKFEENNLVYFSFSDLKGRRSFTAVARAELRSDSLVDLQIVYKAPEQLYTRSPYHFGSRILFDNEFLYFSIGDRGEMNDAQDLSKPNGKIHRILDNGDIPHDNPFSDNNNKKSSVWCFGNRNPQGLAMNIDGDIWELEHGPKGGDELNIIKKGHNYGWPVITYGINYDGRIISDKTHMDGMEQPVWHWTPSIAVCGMKFYYGETFGPWTGNILVTSLKFEYLERVIIDNDVRIGSEIIYEPGSRVRDVEVDSNGDIYVALENPGRIVRLTKIIK